MLFELFIQVVGITFEILFNTVGIISLGQKQPPSIAKGSITRVLIVPDTLKSFAWVVINTPREIVNTPNIRNKIYRLNGESPKLNFNIYLKAKKYKVI